MRGRDFGCEENAGRILSLRGRMKVKIPTLSQKAREGWGTLVFLETGLAGHLV